MPPLRYDFRASAIEIQASGDKPRVWYFDDANIERIKGNTINEPAILATEGILAVPVHSDWNFTRGDPLTPVEYVQFTVIHNQLPNSLVLTRTPLFLSVDATLSKNPLAALAAVSYYHTKYWLAYDTRLVIILAWQT
ncbi:uncharacterized protein CANTADRAFT_24237 [Suhomyces tanzawaensis NRRL Y-17324]|uniref:Uncharacterized protein n=1 Tax=Suhomyces tanzawaensis NRRL Y-17324 TaxID=984487 RepID=A0A1E4SAW0_9ASCO|nr:uncharacterized protein CANTADRAFT_24237 [Suhomyces tanzawaensis NRRL Y-17324]ODV76660.1 hypothetical protein CANTADRAFT_24237 [Suhomyces tanzawaensis NRRL Y-17324]